MWSRRLDLVGPGRFEAARSSVQPIPARPGSVRSGPIQTINESMDGLLEADGVVGPQSVSHLRSWSLLRKRRQTVASTSLRASCGLRVGERARGRV